MVRAMPVSWLVAATVAPETTAPVWSVTRPDKLAETCAWAPSEPKHSQTSNRKGTRRPARSILPSLILAISEFLRWPTGQAKAAGIGADPGRTLLPRSSAKEQGLHDLIEWNR